jgi:uncharacterized protein YyaL (SSP411 family)
MGYQASGNAFFRDTAEQTIRYVLRDLTDPGGGFYSTEDADSEGVEGKFFVWTGAQLVEALGPDEAEVAARYWDVSEHGNWEHTNILNLKDDPAEVARAMGITAEELRRMIDRIRPKLFARREQRIRPGRDEKVLTSWNGASTASSRTTPATPTGCSRSTRRRTIGAGSPRRGGWPTRWSSSSPTRPALASSTPASTTSS